MLLGSAIGNNSPNTLIGGDTVSARNVIVPAVSGIGIDISNTHGGVSIRGNFIGTDITGMTRLENTSRAINMLHTTGIAIGGPTATTGMPPGNLIVSSYFGIGGQVMSNLTVQGNLIGTNITGAVLPPPVGGQVPDTDGLSLQTPLVESAASLPVRAMSSQATETLE